MKMKRRRRGNYLAFTWGISPLVVSESATGPLINWVYNCLTTWWTVFPQISPMQVVLTKCCGLLGGKVIGFFCYNSVEFPFPTNNRCCVSYPTKPSQISSEFYQFMKILLQNSHNAQFLWAKINVYTLKRIASLFAFLKVFFWSGLQFWVLNIIIKQTKWQIIIVQWDSAVTVNHTRGLQYLTLVHKNAIKWVDLKMTWLMWLWNVGAC